MVSKKYHKYIFLTSGVIALLIFSAGILLGWTLDNYRVNEIIKLIRENEINSESYFVEEEFLETFGGDKCELLSKRINDLFLKLSKTGQELSLYESKNIFNNGEFDYLRSKYFLLEIKFYTLLYDMDQNCEENRTVILFLYKRDDEASKSQGYVLDSLVKKYKEKLIVLSIDKYYEDENIKILSAKYNITKTPTLIINFDLKKEGFMNKEKLDDIIKE